MSASRKFPEICLVNKPIAHQVNAMGRLETCLKEAGYRVRRTYHAEDAANSIVFVWSWGKAVIVRQKNPKAIILCMDHAYMPNRKKGVVNTAWSTPDMPCGLNGWGEHPLVEDNGARLMQQDWLDFLKPLRKPKNKVALVFGQVFGDAAIQGHVEEYPTWLRGMSEGLRKEGWETRFRPHPVTVRRGDAGRYGNVGRNSVEASLYDALDNCSLTAAFNSNACTEGYIYGIPARVWNEGSMLWPLVENPGLTTRVDEPVRRRWFEMLAYCQWTMEELSDGTWLKYHEPIMHRLVEGGACRPWHTLRFTETGLAANL